MPLHWSHYEVGLLQPSSQDARTSASFVLVDLLNGCLNSFFVLLSQSISSSNLPGFWKYCPELRLLDFILYEFLDLILAL